MARSRLPWAYRKELGRWKAYWRTVWLGTWKVRILASEVNRPVDERDARRFARITALVAGLPFAAAMLLVILREGGTNFLNPLQGWTPTGMARVNVPLDAAIPLVAGLTRWWMLPVSIVLFVWLIAGSKRIWFAAGALPAVMRNRGAALSYYAVAPLVFMPVGLAIWATGVGLRLIGPGDSALFQTLAALLSIGWGVSLFCLFESWLVTLLLHRRTTRPGPAMAFWTAVGVPAWWALCALLAFVVLPWVVGFLHLMVDSLR